MLKSRILLRHAVQSAPSTSSSEYMPSKQFMYSKVKRPSQKSHFVKVASEIELYKDVYGDDALKKLKINDDTWKVLMEMSWEDRFSYIMEMRSFSEKNGGKLEENSGMKISEINEARWKRGEMVYARHFHALLDLYGADFRRQIDINYGRNVMKQQKQRNLIVDCRFLRDYSVTTQAKYTNQMQALHDDNWLSDTPFSITFANYQADAQLVEIAKRNLKFQYGPGGGTEHFQRHPFAPTITPRRIDSVEKKENLLYISPKATRFVPDKIPQNVTGVVLCLSNEFSPATSSTSACIADKIVPYRIPFQKFIRSERFRPSHLQLWQFGHILRDYFSGETTIGESIGRNIQILERAGARKDKEVEEKDEVFRSAMLQINNCSHSNSAQNGAARRNTGSAL